MRTKRVVVLLFVICCAGLFAIPPRSASGDGNLRINGTLVAMSGRFAGRTYPISLLVNSYTAPNRIRELNEALSRGGQDELLKVLSKMDAGRIQIGNNVGVPANVIIAEPWGDGGTKITALYERNVRFFELRYGTRSEDYRIGYAEMFLNRNGRGEGTLIGAARVRLRGENTWEVEDFGTFPARLMALRSSGSVVPR